MGVHFLIQNMLGIQKIPYINMKSRLHFYHKTDPQLFRSVYTYFLHFPYSNMPVGKLMTLDETQYIQNIQD